MDIRKSAGVLETGSPTPEQLTEINKLAKSPLAAEDVYVFAVRLCDDQPDRDLERFSPKALEELAPMFVGKTGILDHNWQSDKQTGRIFRTELCREDGVVWLKAWVYMLRSERTADLIRDIEGGIKKEVSVGCAMGRTICSVCGQEYGSCRHRKGETYDGEMCYAVLCDPKDAYEFSFVAVPAQRESGVVKAAGRDDVKLARLEREAAYGRLYRGKLEAGLVRAALVLDLGLDEKTLRTVAEGLDMERLLAVEDALSRKAAELFPAEPQLAGETAPDGRNNNAFLI